MTAPKLTTSNLRDAIAETLWRRTSAYELAGICMGLGLSPQQDDEDPMRSKRAYVRARLMSMSLAEMLPLAQRVVDEFDDEDLAPLLNQTGARGVAGELRNIIFAADGPKPRLVLRDAINNVVEIVEGADRCLVYDRPLHEHGLSWQELVAWWRDEQGLAGVDDRLVGLALYERLFRSLANEAEQLIFRTYCRRYGTSGFGLPALLPQVYLHYDPYARAELGDQPGPLTRQRMDFLLLLPNRCRVVIELDGKQHYADDSGRASPTRYASMVAEDRSLRLGGYEVFRFGGSELRDQDAAATMLDEFSGALLNRYDVQT